MHGHQMGSAGRLRLGGGRSRCTGSDLGFDLEPDGDGTRLRQWAQMGPGPSGVTMLIGRDPDAEEMIVAGRLRQWQRNMDATVAGIRALAESSLPPAR